MLGGEPLIFVEVALLEDVPTAIAPLLDSPPPAATAPQKFKVAAFYSISNCQPGLRGINLGNFLIKRVAEQLQSDVPTAEDFLHPVAGAGLCRLARPTTEIKLESLSAEKLRRINETLAALRKRQQATVGPGNRLANTAARTLAAAGNGTGNTTAPGHQAGGRAALRSLCACYLLLEPCRDRRGRPGGALSPEQRRAPRAHQRPGRPLAQRRCAQSHGLMVNYLYDLDEIENNHEAFVGGSVSASRAVTSLI